jgi:hypothetical protein
MSNFEQACLLSCHDWVNTFDYCSEFEFSKSFEKKIDVLFDKMRKDRYHVFTKRTLKTLVIAAIILSFATTVFAVPNTREYIIKKFSNHSSYAVVDDSNFEKVIDLDVEYVPDGFDKNNEFYSDYLITVDYKNGEQWFSIRKCTLNSNANFDTESYKVEKYIVDEITYNVYQTETNVYGVIWNDGEYIYTIDGNVSKDELMKIALKTQ